MPGVQVGSGRRRRRRALARPDHAARRAHEARRGPPAAPEDDGGDGPAGLRPVRLRLQGLRECAVQQERRAAEPLRAGRQGNRPHAEGAACGDRLRAGACRSESAGRCRAGLPRSRRSPPARSRDNPVEATFVSRALLNKKGSAKETWHIEFDLTECGLDYQVGDAFGLYPHNDPALADAVLKALDAPADFPIGGRTLARGADRRRFAVARARHAVPAVLLHHRRRAAEEGAGAVRRRGPRRRRGDARRAGGDREVFRRAPGPRGLHRGARPAAAAALFDLVVAEGAQGPRLAHRRYGALRHRQAKAPRRRLDLPRRPRRARATSSASMCRRRMPSACRPIRTCRSSWSGPAPAWRRSAPSCTSAWRPRRRAATGCSSATRSATSISSTRTSSPA